MILEWTYETDDEFKHLKGKIVSTADAIVCAEADKHPKDRNPDWRACEWIGEYLTVREAFEKEKANGGPTCGKWGKIDNPSPDGPDYCVGDATQALIKSDYFPW